MSASIIGETQMKEFLPFLIFFIALMALLMWKPAGPWIITVAILGCVYGWVTSTWIKDIRPVLMHDKYPTMADITKVELADFSYLEKFPDWSSGVFVGSLKVAFVAVLETLISARIADNMTGSRFHQSDEVRGLAYANMLSGALGNLPCTGVLIRTSVNVQSQATHKTAQFINALWVLAMVLLLLPLFSWIPMAVIASILITSSFRLVPKYFIAQTFKADKFECFLLLLTWAGCAFIDSAMGLLLGTFIALAREGCKVNLKFNETAVAEDDAAVLPDTDDRLRVTGRLNFVNCIEFEDKLIEKLPTAAESKCLTVYFDNLEVLDFDGLQSLRVMKKKCATYLPKIQKENGEEEDDPIELKIVVNPNCKENRLYALFHQDEFNICKDSNGDRVKNPNYIPFEFEELTE